jgi:hypothetical protein
VQVNHNLNGGIFRKDFLKLRQRIIIAFRSSIQVIFSFVVQYGKAVFLGQKLCQPFSCPYNGCGVISRNGIRKSSRLKLFFGVSLLL